MKNTIGLKLWVVCLVVSLCVAGDIGAQKIMFVDTKKVISQSEQMKEINQWSSSKKQELEAHVERKREELMRLKGDLAKKAGALSKEAYDKEAERVTTLIRDEDRSIQERVMDLESTLSDLMTEIVEHVKKIASEFDSSDIVLSSEAALFYDKSLDLTDHVQKLMKDFKIVLPK